MALTCENISGFSSCIERSAADTAIGKEEGAQGSAGRKEGMEGVSGVEKELEIVSKRKRGDPGSGPTALQRVEQAHGEAADAAPSAPHHHSRRSDSTAALLRASVDPVSWTQASCTKSNAGFTKRKATKASASAARDYKRRRLGDGCVAPAWFSAVAADVPAVADWWREAATISATPSGLRGAELSALLKKIIQGDTADRPALVDDLYAWAEKEMDVDGKMERAMAAAATSQGMRWRRQGDEADKALLRREVPAQVREAAAAARPPPKPPAPPPTAPQNPDRKPHDGYTGELTFGEPTAGAGAFIRFGQHLGGKCLFFAEHDDEAAGIAALEAPAARRFRDICTVAPADVPEVFTLIGGPECQPFSRAGKQRGFQDPRSNTLLWFFWCLAERRFPSALIENARQLQRSNGGSDWRVCQALAAATGYKISTQQDCASRWGYAEVRQRIFISLVRDDLFDEWGRPPELVHPTGLPRQSLEEILLPPDSRLVQQEVSAFAAMLAAGGDPGRWIEPAATDEGQPQCEWKIGDGKWGKRGFTHATPAHKVYGDDP